jgi:hypothetical protein
MGYFKGTLEVLELHIHETKLEFSANYRRFSKDRALLNQQKEALDC